MPKYIIFWCITFCMLCACTPSVARDVPSATRLPTMTPVADTPLLPSPSTIATMPPSATARVTATAIIDLDTQTSVTAEGYYAFGSDQAPVTFVDYSDFFWGSCAFHVLEVEPQLIENYVNKGLMQIVVRPLLQTGPDSLLAAHAAACAGDQQRYFTMRTAIYANQGELYMAPDMGQALAELARAIGVDTTTYAQCMAQNIHSDALIAQYTLAKNDGILARPVFEINGQRIIGAQPYAQFQAIIDSFLK